MSWLDLLALFFDWVVCATSPLPLSAMEKKSSSVFFVDWDSPWYGRRYIRYQIITQGEWWKLPGNDRCSEWDVYHEKCWNDVNCKFLMASKRWIETPNSWGYTTKRTLGWLNSKIVMNMGFNRQLRHPLFRRKIWYWGVYQAVMKLIVILEANWMASCSRRDGWPVRFGTFCILYIYIYGVGWGGILTSSRSRPWYYVVNACSTN